MSTGNAKQRHQTIRLRVLAERIRDTFGDMFLEFAEREVEVIGRFKITFLIVLASHPIGEAIGDVA
ncbi:MAG: hypothetical protein WKF84_14675 [Pyrinomonadaceae bacterium]